MKVIKKCYMVQNKDNKEEFLGYNPEEYRFYWGKFTEVESEVYYNKHYAELMAEVHGGVIREGSLMVLS